MSSAIAIVGLACRYPDARSPAELWENVLAQRRAFRRIPSERLRLEDYLSSDRSLPDALYVGQAAVIEGYTFDRVRFRVAGSTYRQADLSHWLALDVAIQALADAGFPDGEGLPRASTGAIVGNTLTGEFSRSNVMRLRWPYVRRVVESGLEREGVPSDRRRALLEKLEASYKEPFPEVGDETLAGGLSNTIAGRICNHLDLKGGGYTVDGACSASLLAVITACRSLDDGDLDVAIAGGVDLSLDPFELVGFAKVGALAPEEMRVYDQASEGFWPGEGSGFVVLMRHEEAVAQGRRIYATIRGWGVSSDGSGGITRPEAEGQTLAVERAYRRAGFGIDSVAYFEGHGTGTAVGDATELEVLSSARRLASSDAPSAAIGSIKANIGHTKAAAGIAGLLKATLALHHQVIPPTTGCDRPHGLLTGSAAPLRVPRRAEAWPARQPLRAAVSAMGFGGINTHVVLESSAESRASLPAPVRDLASSWQDAELFLFAAADREGLAEHVRHLLAYAPRVSRSELTDLAATLAREGSGTHRAAVIAATPAELAKGLETLIAWLEAGESRHIDADAGVFLGGGERRPRIAYLFSGQASPVHLDGGAIARRFADTDQLYDLARLPAGEDTVATAVAQPAIVAASLAGLRVLDRLGIEASAAVGHSLGEITALRWAGVLDEDATIRIATARGKAMMETPGPPSGMLGIAATADRMGRLLEGTPVVIAGLNLPRQTVVSGPLEALDTVAARARAAGWRAVRLPVSHAFHSPLMAPAAPVLAEHLAREEFRNPTRALFSTITGTALAQDGDLRSALCAQLTNPVRFMDAVQAAGEVDLWIEVGPGQVLTGLARELVSSPVISTDAAGPSLRGILGAAGAAFALGATLDRGALFEGRFTRPFDLDWKPVFFANPCESAPVPEGAADPGARDRIEPSVLPAEAHSRKNGRVDPASAPPTVPAPVADVLELVRGLVAERTELPLDAVHAESRLLDDLHMNSISVAQLVALASKRLGLKPSVAPTEYADATVAEVARALEERLGRDHGTTIEEPEHMPAGVDSWIHTFTVELVERSAPRVSEREPGVESIASDGADPTRRGQVREGWRVFSPPGYPLRERLEEELGRVGGRGVVVCLPPEPDDRQVAFLLEGAKLALADPEDNRFILVQHGGGAAGFARTLYLETPDIGCRVVDVPLDHPDAVRWIVTEAAAAAGYAEVHYDSKGLRLEPVLRPLRLEADDQPLPLGPADVLLVTGGGKGIAAECALALARETGCRLAIMARSDPAADPELKANLQRMSATGVDYRYIVADVTGREAVESGIRRAEAAFGPVTAILCGAGLNEPQLLKTLDERAFMKTMAAKVQGARNVLESVDLAKLRLFVAFGSIIARTGMRGEADYALANEWLTRLTERLHTQCPHLRCLSIEWSVWSGVGMGERLGRMDSLMEMGVTPITPDQGIELLRRLISRPLPRTSVVVTGRFGGLPTLTVEQPELPLLRFLEHPRVYFPGIELVVESDLSSLNDPYLDDHVFGGEKLFPAVMGLEAMAQVAAAVTGRSEAPRFEDVRFDRPIVLAGSTPTSIRIAALVREPDRVEVVIRCADTAYQVDHFRAVCRFGAAALRPDSGMLARELNGAARGPESLAEGAASAGELHGAHRVAIDPRRDLYGGVLFHRGRFRRLSGYRLLRARACAAEFSPDGNAPWFGPYLPADLLLGDPAVHDSAMHAIQACIPHATILPIGVDRLTLVPGLANGSGVVHAREISRHGSTLVYDVEVTDEGGDLRARWEGLHLRNVGEAPSRGAWLPALLGPYVERRLEDLIPGAEVRVALEQNGNRERRERSDEALGRLAGGNGSVRRRPDGKPEMDGVPAVSAAHAGDLTLAVAGCQPIGCDLEPVEARTNETWNDLLGSERSTLAHRIALESAEAFDAAATRVWAAGECLKKAGAPAGSPLVLGAPSPPGWVSIAAGALTVATLAVEVQGSKSPLVLAVLASHAVAVRN